MFQRLRPHTRKKPSYSFYIWENGAYVHMEGGQFDTDSDAASAAKSLSPETVSGRPATLEAAHLHVVREDGVHILTLELPEKPPQSVAA